MKFTDRIDAGRQLAEQLSGYRNQDGILVLALPRGGVPVAREVARRLNAPMDIFIVRKLGVPGQEELAFGAIASGGSRVLNPEIVEMAGLDGEMIDRVTGRERVELERREDAYRSAGAGKVPVRGKTVILVDDGIATGASMWSAVQAVRQLGASKIVVAVPVSPPDTRDAFRVRVDKFVAVQTPKDFGGVGRWYENFSQVSDEQVRHYLADVA